MTIRTVTAMMCLVAILSVGQAGEKTEKAPEKVKAPRFTLMDSHDEPFALTFPREKPMLLTFGDQGGADETERWRKALTERYGKRIEDRAVAWLEAIPSLMRGTVSKIIETTYDWVLLDWTGATAKRYRCKANGANIFILSTDGFILFEAHGEMTKKRMDKLFAVLDEALDTT